MSFGFFPNTATVDLEFAGAGFRCHVNYANDGRGLKIDPYLDVIQLYCGKPGSHIGERGWKPLPSRFCLNLREMSDEQQAEVETACREDSEAQE
jgi:hypothetical protein